MGWQINHGLRAFVPAKSLALSVELFQYNWHPRTTTVLWVSSRVLSLIKTFYFQNMATRKPRDKCTPYAFFLNICREKCNKKLSKEVDFKTLSKICWEKWNKMSEYHKRRFVQMAEFDEIRFNEEMMEYKNRGGTVSFFL